MFDIKRIESMHLNGRLHEYLGKCTLNDLRYLELVVSFSDIGTNDKIQILGMIKQCLESEYKSTISPRLV